MDWVIAEIIKTGARNGYEVILWNKEFRDVTIPILYERIHYDRTEYMAFQDDVHNKVGLIAQLNISDSRQSLVLFFIVK